MTGGSLGLRTASYGSLQQNLQNSVVLPVHSMPITIRKPPKMLVPGSREKEKFISRLCKFVSSKKVGMFLLGVASVAVFLSLLATMNKDKDVSEGPGTYIGSLRANYFGNDSQDKSVFIKPSQAHDKDREELNQNSVEEHQSASVLNESQPHHLVIPASPFPSRHPCEGFSFPPPPADRKRTGPRPCPVCYVPVEHAIALMPTSPSISPIIKNLKYISEENSIANESNGGSAFGGHPSLQQRNNSYDIKESMTVHCGFVKGNRPGNGTGFDIDQVDLLEMEQCHGVVVASAIFANYDIMQQPKNISEASQKSVCFYMFVDEETNTYIKNSSTMESSKRVGMWRVVVLRTLPYADARRNGKVPKLLLHRLFPNARFSLWIDGKLELVVDPYQILERFLWRRNSTFAISRHYRRFDVYEEAEANKVAAKYDNASIDHQIEFYKNEGLTHYSPAKLPITSDVPEGCVIIREHTPITNLFTCLWFNEVDRFTSRDQLSFSTVRDKIMSRVNWSVDMFMDCERRNFVVQAYHRDVLDHMSSAASMGHHHTSYPPPPPVLKNEASRKPSAEAVPEKAAKTASKKPPAKRGKDKRSGSRRRRPRATGSSRDNNSI